MTKLKHVIAGFALGCLSSWALFVRLYSPTEHDFRVVATSYYFKRMSEAKHAGIASFSDCEIMRGDASDRKDGIWMFGLCSATDGAMTYYYSVAMSPTANYVYGDFEVVAK